MWKRKQIKGVLLALDRKSAVILLKNDLQRLQ